MPADIQAAVAAFSALTTFFIAFSAALLVLAAHSYLTAANIALTLFFKFSCCF
jgi:hypothetical protein